MKVFNSVRPDFLGRRGEIDERVASRIPSGFRGTYRVLPGDCEREKVNWRGETVFSYSRAIQKALDECRALEIPYSEKPLYITAPIILAGGYALKVDRKTRIILIGESCVLVNKSAVDGHERPVSPDKDSDNGIYVEGGIWESPDVKRVDTGAYRDYRGCDSSVFISNAKNVRLENMTIRDTMRMGVQIGNCERFTVRNIRFENAARDGIHVDGPASYGLISGISGVTGDDVVALNAWDWEDFSLTFGAIHDICIENISCKPSYIWSQMRLLPGVKVMADGIRTECPIYNVHVRNVKGLHTVELYNQHNFATPGRDFSQTLGDMYNIFFEDMDMSYFPKQAFYTDKQAAFEIISNIYNLSFENIRFDYPLGDAAYDNYTALGVGPMSYACEIAKDPPVYEEFFRTNDICMVASLSVKDIFSRGERCENIDSLLSVRRLKPNLDYPNTLPAGGEGFGWVQSLYINP